MNNDGMDLQWALEECSFDDVGGHRNGLTVASCAEMIDKDRMLQYINKPDGMFDGRKSFCQAFGIGESTLSGWLNGKRIPKVAKLAVFLCMIRDRLNISLSYENDARLIKDGDKFMIATFRPDTPTGEISARDIPDVKTGKAFLRSYSDLKILFNSIELKDGEFVIDEMAVDFLRDIVCPDGRISGETVNFEDIRKKINEGSPGGSNE